MASILTSIKILIRQTTLVWFFPCRGGFISTKVIDGLQVSGKEKPTVKGRFYSKSGEIFFGHFKYGWRHGEFLCIDVAGTRSVIPYKTLYN